MGRKLQFFHIPPAFDAPINKDPVRILAKHFVWKN